jgi:hypothetical protein
MLKTLEVFEDESQKTLKWQQEHTWYFVWGWGGGGEGDIAQNKFF